MNNTALALTFTLVLAALLISYRQRLDMEKDMIIGSIRAVVQLTLVGFVLKFVFNMDNAPLTGLILLLMVYNAATVAAKRGAGIACARRISFGAILVSLVITLGCLLVFRAIAFHPSDVIQDHPFTKIDVSELLTRGAKRRTIGATLSGKEFSCRSKQPHSYARP